MSTVLKKRSLKQVDSTAAMGCLGSRKKWRPGHDTVMCNLCNAMLEDDVAPVDDMVCDDCQCVIKKGEKIKSCPCRL